MNQRNYNNMLEEATNMYDNMDLYMNDISKTSKYFQNMYGLNETDAKIFLDDVVLNYLEECDYFYNNNLKSIAHNIINRDTTKPGHFADEMSFLIKTHQVYQSITDDDDDLVTADDFPLDNYDDDFF